MTRTQTTPGDAQRVAIVTGGVDIVVHALGRMTLATITDLDLADLDSLHRTNVRGSWGRGAQTVWSPRAPHPGVIATTAFNRSVGEEAQRATGLIDESGRPIIDPEHGKKRSSRRRRSSSGSGRPFRRRMRAGHMPTYSGTSSTTEARNDKR